MYLHTPDKVIRFIRPKYACSLFYTLISTFSVSWLVFRMLCSALLNKLILRSSKPEWSYSAGLLGLLQRAIIHVTQASKVFFNTILNVYYK